MRRNCLLSRVGGRVFQQGLRVLGFVLRSYEAAVTGGDEGTAFGFAVVLTYQPGGRRGSFRQFNGQDSKSLMKDYSQ
jgi:hypothetical protein